MIEPSDSPDEMHTPDLSPDVAEKLLDGDLSPTEFADLAALVADVRAVAESTPTPAVAGALAEFIGVGLTVHHPPASGPESAPDSSTEVPVAPQPRRSTVIAEVLSFAGTVGGKLLIGGAVAAASVTGAHAAGVVDLVPGEPESVVVTTDGDAVPEPLQLDDDAGESDEKIDDGATDRATEGDDVKPLDGVFEQDEIEFDERTDEAKDEPEEQPKDETEEQPKDETEEQPKDEPKEQPKDETEEQPKDEPSAYDLAVQELEQQLQRDKEAVYAAARELITPLEAELKEAKADLEAQLVSIDEAKVAAKTPLLEELEATTDPERRLEIEAEIDAVIARWEADRKAASEAAAPAIEEILSELAAIETDRDAEINRLLEQFRLDVEALG